MLAIAIAFLISTVIVMLVTPLSIHWGQKFKIFALPSARKIHKEMVPSWGGIAIVFGFMIGSVSGWISLKALPDQLIGLVLGLLIIVLVGTLDDLKALSPKAKLLGQCLSAVVSISMGLQISFFNIPFSEGYIYLSRWQSWLLTCLWVVGLINAVNLIDGLDGLAAGISFFAALTLSFLSAAQGIFPIAVAFASISGACIGFLPYNFHPAKVFMGDTGAMALGYLFATLSILGAVKSFAALYILLLTSLVLAYPISDTVFAIVRRWLKRRSVFTPDRGHLHHRLVDKGLDQRQAVLVLYALTLVFCLLAILLLRSIRI